MNTRVVVAIGALCVLTAIAVRIGHARADEQPLTYFIAEGNAAAGYRGSDRELALWALQEWARHANGALTFMASDDESSALLRVYWAEAAAGQYGEMRPIMVNGHRGAAVFIRPDLSALGQAIAERGVGDPLWRETIVYLTCLHELGHALGLAHTADFRDIMYTFQYGGDFVEYFSRFRRQLHERGDIRQASGVSDADIQQLRVAHPGS